MTLGAAGAFVLVLAVAAPAAAKDIWTEPFRGVRYLHRTTGSPRWSLHAVVVDLDAPGIRFAATPASGRRATVSAFARKAKVQVAVNGDFFNLDTRVPVCFAMGGGAHWPGTPDTRECGQLAAGGGRAQIVLPTTDFKPEPWMTEVVSGHPLLVRDGTVINYPHSSLITSRHPRTAAGVSRDGRRLILLVVDGRQKASVGMTGAELGDALVGLGAWTALNLDGGGSSALYLEGQGVMNSPSDGTERQDANHFGVYAERVGAKPTPVAPKPAPVAQKPAPVAPKPAPVAPKPAPPQVSPPAAKAPGKPGTAPNPAPAPTPRPAPTPSPGDQGASPGGGTHGEPDKGRGSPFDILAQLGIKVRRAADRLGQSVAALLHRKQKGTQVKPEEVQRLREAMTLEESFVLDHMRRSAAGPLGHPPSGFGALRRGALWPVRGPVLLPFGPAKDPLLPGGKKDGRHYDHIHTGLDIAAERGTPVHAFDAGKVVHRAAAEILGVYVIVAHPGGTATVYTHLDAEEGAAPHVHEGQWVQAGQTLGRVGTTGLSERPHVHFGVYHGGLMDPHPLLTGQRRL